MSKHRKRKTALLAFLILAFAVSITAAALVAYGAYQDHLANKIYAPSDTVSTPDFNLTIDKHITKSVDLPIDKTFAAQYGGLTTKENCDSFSKNQTALSTSGVSMQFGPSDYDICIERNDSRDVISTYSAANKQFVINYTIAAKKAVDTSKITVNLSVDSGRQLGKQVTAFNDNQFFIGNATTKSTLQGSEAYLTPDTSYVYKPYVLSDLSGTIVAGSPKTGSAYTDVRTTEKTIDFKITYTGSKEYSRIIRISL